tara:strand:+ start:225 stop:1712 length:1488 start_codon:yes stop_codon:yes gene_type:complete
MKKYLIYSGAGDHEEQWLSWAENESSVYDRAMNFYGDDEQVYEKIQSLNLTFTAKGKGTIFTNFANHYEHFKDYEYVLLVDSDLVVKPSEIEEAFERANRNQWSACTFSRDGNDYGFFAKFYQTTGSGIRICNYFEMGFTIVRQDLLKLLIDKWFELELEYSDGIDLIMSNVAHNNNMLPFYVIDDYTFYNPHPTEKKNSREIDAVTQTTWYDRQKKLIEHMLQDPEYWRIGEYIQLGEKVMKRESYEDFKKIYNIKTNMNVYCITPVYDPNIEYLKQNIESIRNQTVPVKHMLVFDGPEGLKKILKYNASAKKNFKINLKDIEILELPVCHRDYGDTPRYMGTVSAFSRGAEAIFWIDDDNWIEPNHTEKMISNLTEKQPIATCQRNICTLEGKIMGECIETDPYKFIDMNCYVIHSSAKTICTTLWTMRPDMHIFDDKVLYANIRESKIPFNYYQTPTVNYRTNFNFHYQHYGYPIPEGAKDGVGVQYANREK